LNCLAKLASNIRAAVSAYYEPYCTTQYQFYFSVHSLRVMSKVNDDDDDNDDDEQFILKCSEVYNHNVMTQT